MPTPPTYGDAVAEYRALTESSAVVWEAHDVVWVEGPDAAGFLQGIVSQDVDGMEVGAVARSFFLSPQGKLEALLWLAKGDQKVAIVVDGGQGEHLAERLGYYRIRVKAEIRREDGPTWELWGPESLEAVGMATTDRWTTDGDQVLIPIPMQGYPRVVVIGSQPPPDLPTAGSLATSAVRVERHEPVFGRDVDEKTIPQETGLTAEAVSFTKGCYLGQELVARIDTRGHVNRLLQSLAITRNVLPPEGASVIADGREVGRLTSVTENLTSPIGLALLRREVEPGTEVAVTWDGGEVPAVVRAGGGGEA